MSVLRGHETLRTPLRVRLQHALRAARMGLGRSGRSPAMPDWHRLPGRGHSEVTRGSARTFLVGRARWRAPTVQLLSVLEAMVRAVYEDAERVDGRVAVDDLRDVEARIEPDGSAKTRCGVTQNTSDPAGSSPPLPLSCPKRTCGN